MLHSCMSWTPATSIGARASHPSRIGVLSERRGATAPSQSYRESSDLVGKGYSPRSFRLFSCRSTPLSSFFSQSRCYVSPLDATLVSPLLYVASKGLAQYLSLVDATLTKNIGAGAWLWLTRHPAKDVCHERPSATRDLSSHPIADSVLVGKRSFHASLLVCSLHSLPQERFTNRFHSAGSALFLKTAGCTGSLPVLELATRSSPLPSRRQPTLAGGPQTGVN